MTFLFRQQRVRAFPQHFVIGHMLNTSKGERYSRKRLNWNMMEESIACGFIVWMLMGRSIPVSGEAPGLE